MTDTIALSGLRVLGHHGALPGEQDRAQPFDVDLALETSFDAAARSDELADAIDYGAVIDTARAVVETRRFALIESIASAIADAVLADARVSAVTVTVRKVRPPVAADIAAVAVTLRRPAAAADS